MRKLLFKKILGTCWPKMDCQVVERTWRVYSLRRGRAQGGEKQDINSHDGVKLSKQKYTQSINKKNCNAEIFLTVRIKIGVILFYVLYTQSTGTQVRSNWCLVKDLQPCGFHATHQEWTPSTRGSSRPWRHSLQWKHGSASPQNGFLQVKMWELCPVLSTSLTPLLPLN